MIDALGVNIEFGAAVRVTAVAAGALLLIIVVFRRVQMAYKGLYHGWQVYRLLRKQPRDALVAWVKRETHVSRQIIS